MRANLPSAEQQWGKELRLLFHLAPMIMPPMEPPTGIIDTSGGKAATESRWIDPADQSIHPFVRTKYLGPEILRWAAAQPPPQVEIPTRVYPALLISPGQFASRGLFAWPYKNAEEVLIHVEEVVRGQLMEWRDHPVPFEQSIPQTPQLSIPLSCRTELRRLATGFDVDVAHFYATLKSSGDLLLKALSLYQDLERHRRECRREMRRIKQRLETHLSPWKDWAAADQETLERLQKHKEDILRSLDLIFQPTDKAIHRYRRQLGVTPRRQQQGEANQKLCPMLKKN